MIIHTTNESLAALLAPYALRMPDDDHAFCMALATVQQLDRLCTVMTTKFVGQWSVDFDGKPAPLDDAGLTENLDDEWGQPVPLDDNIAKAFILSPMNMDTDSEDLTGWMEDVYRQPVTMGNCEIVGQYFRFWFAATYPDKYVNPATQRRDKVKDAQAARRDRLTQAANRLNYATIDKLAVAVLALSDEDAATLLACLAEVTQKT